MERELEGPVDIADARGGLRREAVGWARQPVFRANLPRTLPRYAAWNYWCITSRSAALTLLVADVRYAGAVLVSFVDFAHGKPVDRVEVRPRGLGFELPPSPRGDVVVDWRRLRLAMRERGEALHVEADARPLLGPRVVADVEIVRPRSHETLNVLVPFGDEAFQLTSKQQALPARGVVRVGSTEHAFGPDSDGFACLDFGRGRWPRGIEWNWAFGSGARGGRSLGFNLGGRWTDGTGVTENAFVVDGRLHKISEAVDFTFDRRDFMAPWRVRTREGGRVDLTFTPRTERVVKLPLGPFGVELHQHMGVYSGALEGDAGERVEVREIVGLAEWLRARW